MATIKIKQPKEFNTLYIKTYKDKKDRILLTNNLGENLLVSENSVVVLMVKLIPFIPADKSFSPSQIEMIIRTFTKLQKFYK